MGRDDPARTREAFEHSHRLDPLHMGERDQTMNLEPSAVLAGDA